MAEKLKVKERKREEVHAKYTLLVGTHKKNRPGYVDVFLLMPYFVSRACCLKHWGRSSMDSYGSERYEAPVRESKKT